VVPISPLWTTNGGGIDGSGLFTAQTTPASGRLVTATDGTISGTAVVDIVTGTLATIVVTPDPAVVEVGATQQFAATGYDVYNNVVPISPLWTTNGGSISGSGLFTAQTTPASGRLVTATDGTISGTAVVDIVTGTLATIVVTPNPAVVEVGATQQFVATGYDVYNNVVPISPLWTTNGGTIDAGGLFTAQTTPASGRLVTATDGTVSGAAIVDVVHGGATAIQLDPAAATVTAGESQPYTVTARDAYNNAWSVSAASTYTITPGAGGTWVSSVYTSELAGTWTVAATYLGLTDTAELTVTHAPLAISAALSPDPHTIGAGGQVVYTLIATDTYGNAWDATASGAYTVTPAAGGSWAANVYTSQYTGTWTVTATVPNATATAVLTVTELPAASFIRVPAGEVCINGTIQFTDTSAGGPTDWLWDFGDSVGANVQHPTHAYTSTGLFTVTLDVTNPYGSDTAADTVSVVSAPVIAITRSSIGSVCTGANVAFTATNSGGSAAYFWSFGDGMTATGQVANHAYSAPGIYTVWLTGTNACALDVVSTTVTVASGPSAGFTRDPAGDVPVNTTVQFTDTSTGGPTVWLWDFGDGFTSTVQHPTHAYAISGTFTITLTVTSTCGSDSTIGTITILTGCVGASIANLSSDSPVALGEVMHFTATVTGDVPITYTWDWGDGLPPVSGVSGSGMVTGSHVYVSAGSYTATLTVTNSCGVGVDRLVVTVGCVPVSGADFSWDPVSPATTETVTFTGTVSGGSPPVSYIWEWGDDTVGGTGNPAFHTFTISGTYTVVMTATNDCGVVTATHTVTVSGSPFTPTYGVVLDPGSAAQSGVPGAPVVYTLTLTNTGDVPDSFGLGESTVGEPWATTVVPLITDILPPSGTTSVIVSVLIPPTASGGEQSVATVMATSVSSPTVSDRSTLTTTVATTCTAPAVTSLISDSPVDLGEMMYFTATVTGDVPITYTWDWGDGTPPVGGATAAGAINVSHLYAVAGGFTVTLSVENNCGSDSRILAVTVNATPGVPHHITLVAVPSSVPLNGLSVLTATVYDGFNTPLAGQVLTFTTSDPLGVGSLVPLLATTNGQGQTTSVISSTVLGVKRVTATAFNLVAGSTNVRFFGRFTYLPLVMRGYEPPRATLTLVASPMALVVGDSSILEATALDVDGSPIQGMAVTFSTPDPLGGGTLTPLATTTDANGQILAIIDSTLMGTAGSRTVRVTARASNGTSDTVTLVFRSTDACALQLFAIPNTGPEPREVALDVLGRRAFVAHAEGVTVLDSDSFATIAEISSIAYDPDHDHIWVTTRDGTGRVRVLEGLTYTIVADLPAGDLPHSAAYNPSNGRVYVTNYGSRSVEVYSAAGLAWEQTLTGFSQPAHIGVNHVTNKIYVANHGANAGVTVIDGATHDTGRINTALIDAYGVAVDTTRNLVYVTAISHGRIVIIDGATDEQIGGVDVRRGSGEIVPLRVIAVNPDVGSEGHLLVVTSSEDSGQDQLLLIPNGWPSLGTPVPLNVTSYPQEGIALDPITQLVWVTSVGSGQANVAWDGLPVCSIPFSLMQGNTEPSTFRILPFATP